MATDSEPLLLGIFAIGVFSCCFAFLLILVSSFWGRARTNLAWVTWAADMQKREASSEGSLATTKNRLIKELALEVRWSRRLSTFWEATSLFVSVCQLSVTGGTTLAAWKQHLIPSVLSGMGVLGVLATFGNGFFKPKLLAERYLIRARRLANARREAEADWDATPTQTPDAVRLRKLVIEKLISALNETYDDYGEKSRNYHRRAGKIVNGGSAKKEPAASF
jgi:hypothetical protein